MSSEASLIEKKVFTDILCAVLRGKPVDWPAASETDFYDALLQQSIHHGVGSLVCYLLKKTPAWEKLPDQMKDGLLQGLRTDIAFDMVRTRDLLALLEALEQVGIFSLILKGGALAHTHYPEPFLRSRCDTDIFIQPTDIRNIRKVFLDLGYRLSGRIYKSHQFNHFKEELGGAVNYDVHWRLSNRSIYARVLSSEEIAGESVPVPGVDGAKTLRPVHALLLACMHRAGNPRHDPDRLIWLYDIHLLLSAMSDSELLEFARRAVAENIQAICLEAIEKSCTSFATRGTEAIQKILLTPPKARTINQRFNDSALGLIIDDLRQLSDVRSRLELVREYLFPSADYLLGRYGKEGWGWVPLLYVRYVLVGVFERATLR